TVTLTLTVSDPVSGFGDSAEVSASADSVATGIEGANERDSEHLENHRAEPLPPADLLAKALNDVKLGPAASKLATRLFVARAVAAFNQKRPSTEVVGNLLFARDAGEGAAELGTFAGAY